MKLEDYNSFYIAEQNSIPPISDMYTPELDESIAPELALVSIHPIFGNTYSALLQKNKIIPYLYELLELNNKIKESEKYYTSLYYKKHGIPLIGWLLARPVEKEGDKKLREFENISRELHQKIESIVISHMNSSDYDEMIQSSNDEHEEFKKNIRRMGYMLP